MAHSEASVLEVKVEAPQLEFLESKAKELGISKEELVKSYIEKAIDVARGENGTSKKRFSLQGIVSAGTVTDEDIEEARKIWQPETLP